MNWEKIKLYATTITAILGLSGIIYTGVVNVDTRYAKKVPTEYRLVSLEQKQTLKDLKDLLNKALDKYYFYDEQIKKHVNNEKIKKLYRESEKRVEYLEKRIEKIEEEQEKSKKEYEAS